MPCFRPISAYRAQGGQVVFDSKSGWSDRPLSLPCGQCIDCRIERARQWAIRCVHESQMHRLNCVVTLTYDDRHVPPDGGLRVEDWQLFAKRLRKRMGSFRFFHCGEYGDKNFRPHYHAILFGLDFHTDRQLWRRKSERRYFRSAILEELWPMGHSEIGDFSYQSAEYVTRYITKKLTGDRGAEEYGDLRPPYVTMSRRPGIGSSWFDKFSGDVYPADEVIHDGRRFRPPRFYDEKLDQVELDLFKRKRLRKARLRKDDLTPERLKTREFVKEDAVSRLERKL